MFEKLKSKSKEPKKNWFQRLKSKTKSQSKKDSEAVKKAFKELQVNEFIRYLRSPWRIMWSNFLAGVFRGLGVIVGMTVVFAVLVWVLAGLVDFPLIGQYFEDLKDLLEAYTNQSSSE